MKVYIIRQGGVYWHQIFHVGTEKARTIELCKEMALSDTDSHHDWVVSEFNLNEVAVIYKPGFPHNELKTENFEIELFRTDKEAEERNG